jgi:serine/threonine protein kinase/Tol biopolymer transport system component
VPLSAGKLLGPYEILSLVGAGGMGEVYRARDSRLNRTVAIKILTTHVGNRPDLKARFEREARTLATLSHPHICSVFDVGQQDGVDYLVMEFLEGETLAQRLRRHPLPLNEALKIAIQLADALDKAHRQSIVHRDLKPGNVVLTKAGAKIVDFGLAKLVDDGRGPIGATGLSTHTPMTAEGTILGTMQYMAPEQLEAREADARTDIFAFGAIVYEMVTGRRSFEEKSQASLIAAILDREPPAMSTLQPLTPSSLERVIRKCLAKDPDARWQSAGDLLEELKWIADGTLGDGATGLAAQPRRKRTFAVWAIVSTILLAAALVAIWVLPVRPQVQADEIRFEVPAPDIVRPRQITISPDGRWLAFIASTETGTAIFLKRFASTKPEQLIGTDGASSPFWSPDSREIAFFSGGRLKKIGVTGGPVQNLCESPNLAGGTWNSDGVIVFGAAGVLNRTSAAGGERRPISVRDESRQETSHTAPQFLPDGRRYLYHAWSPQQSNSALYVSSLDSKDRTRLLAVQSKAVYANSGYLLFHRQGILFAQPFDVEKAALTGEPVRVADEVSYEALGADAAFDVSDNGRLIYFAGGGPALDRQFVWHDRTGRPLGTEGKPGLYTTNFDLSPDGTQIAVAQGNRQGSQFDIWLVDWARDLSRRLTFDPALTPNGNVVWSSDGSRVAFASQRAGNRDIFQKNVNGVGTETPLLATPVDEWPEDWSEDGRYLAYGRNTAQGTTGAGGIFALPLFGDRRPITIADTPFGDDEPRFSKDGRWVAYNSDESGTFQVYLVSFPAIDQKRQISTDGGVQPRWRRDGKELFYLGLDGRIMAVDLRIDSTIDAGVPRPLFNTRLSVDPIRDQFAVAADGQRFLVQVPVVVGLPTPITVLVNWRPSLSK